MERITLTPRLACMAALVPQDARLADIGTDHGKLPVSLLLERRVLSAIGSDIHQKPLAHAARNAEEHGVALPLRLAAGLDAICPAECDTISIAGMGGQTIAEILSAAPWTADGNHLLLLQPMTMVDTLRQWLWANGYDIRQETLCQEGQRWYVILSVRGGAARQQKNLSECMVSAALLQADGAPVYLSWLLARARKALAGMERSRKTDSTRLTEQRAVVYRLKRALEELKIK